VLEDQALAGLSPPLDIDLLDVAEPVRLLEAFRPRNRDVVEKEPEHRAGVMRDASVALARIAFRDANGDDW
jgi:hypothetical protein